MTENGSTAYLGGRLPWLLLRVKLTNQCESAPADLSAGSRRRGRAAAAPPITSLEISLKTEKDASYRETKHALTRYLLNSNARGKWTLTLQLMWMRQMPAWFRKNLPAEMLGLVDHRPVFGWRDDASKLMAEIMQRGYRATSRKYVSERFKAMHTLAKQWKAYRAMRLIALLRGKKDKQLKRIKCLQERVRALIATTRKLEALKPFFADELARPPRRKRKAPRKAPAGI